MRDGSGRTLTAEELEALIEKVQSAPRVAARHSITDVIKSLVTVQPMTAPNPDMFRIDLCDDATHPGCGGMRSDCDHPECAVRTVLES